MVSISLHAYLMLIAPISDLFPRRRRRRRRSQGRRSGTRQKSADPLGQRHQFRHGSDLHFLHHPLAVRLDRALRAAQGIPGLLVGLAANNKLEDLPFARRQSRDTSANHIQLGLLATRNFMTGYSPVYCGKKLVRRYGLDEEILRTRLDGPHRGWQIGLTRKKNDGQGRAKLAEAAPVVLVRSIPASEHRGGRSPIHYRWASFLENSRLTDSSRPRSQPCFKRRSIAARNAASSSTTYTNPKGIPHRDIHPTADVSLPDLR